jgi:hypothetical protein
LHPAVRGRSFRQYGVVGRAAVAPDLEGAPRMTPDQPRRWSFEAFHAQHPECYDLFKRFAHELYEKGVRRYGARSIGEHMRWHYAVNQARDGGFKLNDHCWPRYARMLMAEDARFRQFFEVRERAA